MHLEQRDDLEEVYFKVFYYVFVQGSNGLLHVSSSRRNMLFNH